MRITEIQERSIPSSRYADPAIPPGGLTTSIVTVTTDIVRKGNPVVGYGFASVGRLAQSGLIRERFAPRLLKRDTWHLGARPHFGCGASDEQGDTRARAAH